MSNHDTKSHKSDATYSIANLASASLVLTSANDLLATDTPMLAITPYSNLRIKDAAIGMLNNYAETSITFEPTLKLTLAPYVLDGIKTNLNSSYLNINTDPVRLTFNPINMRSDYSLIASDYMNDGPQSIKLSTTAYPFSRISGIDSNSLFVTTQDNVLNSSLTKYYATDSDNLFYKSNMENTVLKASVAFNDNSLFNIAPNNCLQIAMPKADDYSIRIGGAINYLDRTNELLGSFAYTKIGSAINCDIQSCAAITGSFVNFSSKYSELYFTSPTSIAGIAKVPSEIAAFTPSEYYLGSALVRTLSAPDQLALPSDFIDYQRVVDDKVRECLYNFDPEMVPMLDGARQALKSSNPDRIRHFATSLRELFTHILHRLSPDNKIAEWTKDANNYFLGKPTRRARLLYICNGIGVSTFEEYVESDVNDVLSFLNLFQEGTHAKAPSFSEEHLNTMLTRMEGLITFTINIGKAN